jgi:hypothetical protein
LSSAHWIIDLYAQHWALREITTCSPQCGLLTFFSPPFQPTMLLLLLCHGLLFCAGFLLSRLRTAHIAFFSLKGMADSLLLDACWVLFKNRFLFLLHTCTPDRNIRRRKTSQYANVPFYCRPKQTVSTFFFRMIYYISAAFILTVPNGLLADWDPSSL